MSGSVAERSSINAADPHLAWRIPEGYGRSSLRFALVQIAFATVVVGLMVVLLAPMELQNGLLTASLVLAGGVAALRIWRAQREAQAPANVWLNAAGLHWRNATGAIELLPRALVESYVIARDEETRRDVPSLTLLLVEGFVSQPIELHPPATEATMHHWLSTHWQLFAAPKLPDDRTIPLDLTSEFDLARQTWKIAGHGLELRRLADVLAEAAQLSIPPRGARPHQLILDFSNAPCGLAIAADSWLDEDFFAATPQQLTTLATALRTALDREQSFTLPLTTGTGHHWEIQVRSEKLEDRAAIP